MKNYLLPFVLALIITGMIAFAITSLITSDSVGHRLQTSIAAGIGAGIAMLIMQRYKKKSRTQA